MEMTRREDGTDHPARDEQEADYVMDSRVVLISGMMKCFHRACAGSISVITVTVLVRGVWSSHPRNVSQCDSVCSITIPENGFV